MSSAKSVARCGEGRFCQRHQVYVRDEAFEALEPPRRRLRLVAQPALDLRAGAAGGTPGAYRARSWGRAAAFRGVPRAAAPADALALGFDEDGPERVEAAQRRDERRIEAFAWLGFASRPGAEDGAAMTRQGFEVEHLMAAASACNFARLAKPVGPAMTRQKVPPAARRAAPAPSGDSLVAARQLPLTSRSYAAR